MVQLHFMGTHFFVLGKGPSCCLQYLNDPLLHVLGELRLRTPPREQLFVCHVDLAKAFWSMCLPPHIREVLYVYVDGAFTMSNHTLTVVPAPLSPLSCNACNTAATTHCLVYVPNKRFPLGQLCPATTIVIT